MHIVSDIWGIPVLDSRSSGIYMNSKDFLEKYTEDRNSISHLNAAGRVLRSKKFPSLSRDYEKVRKQGIWWKNQKKLLRD